jgi:CVNH domain
VFFSLAAAVLLWLALGGLSPATAACPPGAVMDKNGNCVCPPDAKPGQCMVQPPGKGGCNTENLTALCKPRQGPERWARLDNFRQCVGDIANMDGELHCSKGGPPPGGSYTQSCQDIWVEGGVLHAQCKMRDGQWKNPPPSSLNYTSCRHGIENINGDLRCR